MVIIFSCWNTMVGSALVFLPWAFQSSGILFGVLITFVSFLISYYTCSLIIITAKNDSDYVFTLKKYYGKWGWYIGLIGPTILIFGAISVYFNVICQNLYPILWLLYTSISKSDLEYLELKDHTQPFKNLDTFSLGWVSIFMYVILVSFSMKKDLQIFIKMGSIGAFCVCVLILFVIIKGSASMSDPSTKYSFKLYNNTADSPQETPAPSYIYLFNKDFSNLAGVLCAGYFLHQCSLPIVRNSAQPEKNLRNVFLGYVLVFLCYCTVGSIGYIGFSSLYPNQLTGNFLSLFDKSDPYASIVRFMIFC